MKLRIITPFSIFLPLATLVAADTSASSYELKPIALPGANGAVAVDVCQFRRTTASHRTACFTYRQRKKFGSQRDLFRAAILKRQKLSKFSTLPIRVI